MDRLEWRLLWVADCLGDSAESAVVMVASVAGERSMVAGFSPPSWGVIWACPDVREVVNRMDVT